jgi:DNA-binding transcriptional MerR regulator
MLRYIERSGLIEPRRSGSGYRLYGPEELQRLRTLRELVGRFDIGLGEVGFALRLHREPELATAIKGWLEAEAERPADLADGEWLRWEQDKHSKLLAAAGRLPTPAKETVTA